MTFNSAIAAPHVARSTDRLTLTSPSQYQVFQRNPATNKGKIRIAGTYKGGNAVIEARFKGGAWQPIAVNPTKETFTGVLDGQGVGQGMVDVRINGRASTVKSVSTVGVGDVYIIAGQSNAGGAANTSQTYSHATLKAGHFRNSYVWGELQDPVDNWSAQIDTVSAAAAGGSYWPLFVTHYLSNAGVPIALVPCAQHGSFIADWQPGEDPLDRNTLFGSMAFRGITVYGVRGILWHQGESDINNGEAYYRLQLGTLTTAACDLFEAKTGIRPKFMAAKLQAGYQRDYTDVNNAIADFWATHPDALPGADLTGIVLSNTPPEDGLHIETSEQLATAALAWDTAFDNAGLYIAA